MFIVSYKNMSSSSVFLIFFYYFFDGTHKWAEAIGQALHYARLTHKRAAVILIIRKPSDYRHVQKVRDNAEHYGLPLDVWTVREG